MIDDALYTAIFNVRHGIHYGHRSTLRKARLYRHLGQLLEGINYLSGTAAFAAMVSGHTWLTLLIGLVLATAQAFSAVIKPSEKAVRAEVASSNYRALMTYPRQTADDLAKLEEAYRVAYSRDNEDIPEWLRALAYNDACEELGVDRSEHMPLPRMANRLSWLA